MLKILAFLGLFVPFVTSPANLVKDPEFDDPSMLNWVVHATGGFGLASPDTSIGSPMQPSNMVKTSKGAGNSTLLQQCILLPSGAALPDSLQLTVRRKLGENSKRGELTAQLFSATPSCPGTNTGSLLVTISADICSSIGDGWEECISAPFDSSLIKFSTKSIRINLESAKIMTGMMLIGTTWFDHVIFDKPEAMSIKLESFIVK